MNCINIYILPLTPIKNILYKYTFIYIRLYLIHTLLYSEYIFKYIPYAFVLLSPNIANKAIASLNYKD